MFAEHPPLSTESQIRRIVIVDNDPHTINVCEAVAAETHCQAFHAASLPEVLDFLARFEVHLVISDTGAPIFGGRGLLRILKSRFLPIPLICVARDANPEDAFMAVRMGAADYVAKPLSLHAFKERVARVLPQKAPASSDVDPLFGQSIETHYGMIGTSPLMQKVYWLIDRFASGDFCVTILGETGSGKELVARALHESGSRRKKPFVPVDCAAVSSSLFESEFFGHVKGAFTDAVASTDGALLAAGDGTLFLDEIGELPLGLQAKLLRALQEKQIRPVGGNKYIQIGARFVVATNRDLLRSVSEGTFRSDLYFRLTVGQITVPALRERKTDLPVLISAFLKRANESVHTTRSFSNAAMMHLARYSWPGNVRELQSIIYRTVILAEREVIEPNDLPAEIIDSPEHPLGRKPETLNMAELESGAIRRALIKACGDKLAAAKLLGMGRTTIYRKLKQMKDDEKKLFRASVG